MDETPVDPPPDQRAAYYAARPGGWRDWWTLLHPPYTAWHLSYVVIGACLAPVVNATRLIATRPAPAHPDPRPGAGHRDRCGPDRCGRARRRRGGAGGVAPGPVPGARPRAGHRVQRRAVRRGHPQR